MIMLLWKTDPISARRGKGVETHPLVGDFSSHHGVKFLGYFRPGKRVPV